MSRAKDIFNDLASLKDTFESMTTYSVSPVMLLPRAVYNAFWDELQHEGFMTQERWSKFRGEDIHCFNFTIRLMPDEVGK